MVGFLKHLISSGVRQGYPLSPFLFNFIIDEIMEDCVTRSLSSGIELGSFEELVDLDYADDSFISATLDTLITLQSAIVGEAGQPCRTPLLLITSNTSPLRLTV